MDANNPVNERPDDDAWSDDLARRAGAAIRKPAPSGGLAELQRRKNARTIRMVAASGAVGVLLVGGVVLATRSGDGEERNSTPATVATSPTVTESPSTVAAPTTTAETTSTTAPTATIAPEPVVRTLAELPTAAPITDVADLVVDVPYGPAWIGIQGDSLWTTNGISLERVSLEDGSSLGSLKSPPRFQTARRVGAFGSLWAETDVSVVRIDPATMTVVAEVLIPLGPRYANWLSDISPSSDGIWTLSHEPSGEGYAVRIDPTTNTIVDRVAVGKDARSLAFADGSLWIIHAHEISMEGTVTRYDVAGTQLAEFGIAFNASIVVGNEHGVWVQGQAIDGSQANWVVARIDPKTNRLMTTYEVDPGPDWYGTANYDTVVGGGYAWVITKSNVVKIDETTGDVAAVYSGVAGGGVAVSDTDVWVADSGGKKLYRIPLEAGV